MTSKNVLLLGSLLFLLLVTLCSVFFWDRYNTEIATVNLTEPQTDTALTSSSMQPQSEEKHFVEEVPIQSMVARHVAQQAEKAPEQRAAVTSPSETTAPTTTESPRTAQTKQPEVNTTLLQKPSQQNMQSSPKVIQQPNTEKPSKVPKKQKQKRVIIEPVVDTKLLTVSPSGNLYRWDKPWLRDLARRIKSQKNMQVHLKTDHMTPLKRTYMQHIRDYLVTQGIDARRVIIVSEANRSTNIVHTNTQNNQIELLLTERM